MGMANRRLIMAMSQVLKSPNPTKYLGSTSTFSKTFSSSTSTTPLLLIPNSHLFSNKTNTNTSKLCFPYSFFSLSNLEKEEDKCRKKEKKIMTLNDNELSHRRQDLHLFPDDVEYVGSSHGWVGCFNHRTVTTFLFDPLSPSDSIISLPPLQNLFPSMHQFPHLGAIYKLIMSSPPSDPSCTVLVTTSEDDGRMPLALCRPGDTSWIGLQGLQGQVMLGDTDLVYSNRDRRFYVMYCDQTIDALDVSDPQSPKRTNIYDGSGLIGNLGGDPEFYLVESSSPSRDLLLVRRCVSGGELDGCEDISMNTPHMNLEAEDFIHELEVFKLCFYGDGTRTIWNPVESLGEEALFIGKNHSFSLSPATDFGVEPNSIYFTEDHYYAHDAFIAFDFNHHGGCDMGVFNLESGRTRRYYFRDSRKKNTLHQPFWVLPNPKSSLDSLVERDVTSFSCLSKDSVSSYF